MSFVKVLSGFIVLMTVCASVWLTYNPSAETLLAQDPMTPHEPTAKAINSRTTDEPSDGEGQMPVVVRDGRLTVNVQQCALRWILNAISEQSGVAINHDAELAAELISADFQDVYPRRVQI